MSKRSSASSSPNRRRCRISRLLVTTIFADAEKAFGKDKAKKGYKAAQKSVLLGDASVLSSPELAGKLPRV